MVEGERRRALHRRVVAALYVLMEAEGGGGEHVPGAVAELLGLTREMAALEDRLLLQDQGGALHLNGVRILADARGYIAIEGVVQGLRRVGAADVLLEDGVDEDALRMLARVLAGTSTEEEREAVFEGHGGLMLGRRWEEDDGVEPPPAAASQLQVLFVAMRLTAAAEKCGGGVTAPDQGVLRSVAERLVDEQGAVEALATLEDRPGDLAEGVRVCIAAHRIAEAVGLGRDHRREIAAAVLLLGRGGAPLRDFGAFLRRPAPGPLMLRAAMLARGEGRQHDDDDDDGSLALSRTVLHVARDWRALGASAEALPELVRRHRSPLAREVVAALGRALSPGSVAAAP